MLSNSHMVIGNGPDGCANYASGMQDHDTIEEYIWISEMNKDRMWGSAIEIACSSHLFNVPLYVYNVSHAILGQQIFHPILIEVYLEIWIVCCSICNSCSMSTFVICLIYTHEHKGHYECPCYNWYIPLVWLTHLQELAGSLREFIYIGLC